MVWNTVLQFTVEKEKARATFVIWPHALALFGWTVLNQEQYEIDDNKEIWKWTWIRIHPWMSLSNRFVCQRFDDNRIIKRCTELFSAQFGVGNRTISTRSFLLWYGPFRTFVGLRRQHLRRCFTTKVASKWTGSRTSLHADMAQPTIA